MSCIIVYNIYFFKTMRLTNLKTNFYQLICLAVEAAGKSKVNKVDCSLVLKVTCPCGFVCVYVFCDLFLCSIPLLLLSYIFLCAS